MSPLIHAGSILSRKRLGNPDTMIRLRNVPDKAYDGPSPTDLDQERARDIAREQDRMTEALRRRSTPKDHFDGPGRRAGWRF